MILVVAWLVAMSWQSPMSGVAAAEQVISSDRRFDSNDHAAQAIYDASRHLLDAAVSCRSARRPEPRCRPLFEAAAAGQATTANLVHCRLPDVFATHQLWKSFIAALRRFDRGTGSAPAIPGPPRC